MKKETKNQNANGEISKGLQTLLDQFDESIGTSTEAVTKMSSTYALARRKYPGCSHFFSERHPYMSKNRWERLSLIGNGAVDVHIWYLSDRLAAAVLRLDKPDRDAIIAAVQNNTTFTVVNRRGNAKNINPRYFKDEHVRVLIDEENKKIRNKAEQEEYRKTRAAELALKNAAKPPYDIYDGFIEVRRQCKLAKKEVADVLSNADLRDLLIERFGSKEAAAVYILSGK